MPQRPWFDNARLRIAALSIALFAVNAYVCRELFWIEYLRHMGSIEASFISLARYARENWRDLSWFPLWYNGIPYQNAYAPLLHTIVAALSAVTGWLPARAYHITVAFFYCAAPVTLFWLCYRLSRSVAASFMAGLMHSVTSPAALLIADVRGELGGIAKPRRLQTVVIYGEGPHVTGLALLAISILLLDAALQKRRPVYYILASVSFAATATTNWLAGVALAIAVAAYLLAGEVSSLRRRLLGALLIGFLAYAMVAPIYPPSTIQTVQSNARTIEGDYREFARGLPLRLAVLVLAMFAAKYAMSRFRASLTVQFGAYFTIVTAAIGLGWAYAGILFVPQPHRYYAELEWGLAILLPFGLQPLVNRLTPRARVAVIGAAVVIAIPFAKSARRFARYVLEPIDMSQRVEYKMARWLDGNVHGQRVMVPGSCSFWLNAFADTPQLTGGNDQAPTNSMMRIAAYVLYSSDGTGERDAEISLAWLKAFGVFAIATGGPHSGEFYQPFRNPRKFEGKLAVLWRDGGDTLYRVPGRAESLAHAMTLANLPTRPPLNGIDIEPMRPYLDALDDPGFPEAALRWTSRHSARIEANLRPANVVSVQIAHHAGWRATANGRDARMFADALGQMVVVPACNGPCAIELLYDGGAEMRAAQALRWIAIAACALWMIYFHVRKRVAPARPAALS